MNVEGQNRNTIVKTFCELNLMQRNQNVFITENALKIMNDYDNKIN